MSSPPDTPAQADADAELANASDSADGGDGGGGEGGGGEGGGDDTFEGLLRSLRSTEPGVRIPAQRQLRSMRLCDPEQVATVVDVWRHSASEHVRADAGDVLLAVNPLLLAPHVDPVIDGLADCNSFARLAAVAMLQKLLGHGVLTPEVLRQHDEQLMGSLRSEHCDDVVRDLVGNELMTVAFEPGGLGAVGAQENYQAAAGGSSSGSGGGGGGDDGSPSAPFCWNSSSGRRPTARYEFAGCLLCAMEARSCAMSAWCVSRGRSGFELSSERIVLASSACSAEKRWVKVGVKDEGGACI